MSPSSVRAVAASISVTVAYFTCGSGGPFIGAPPAWPPRASRRASPDPPRWRYPPSPPRTASPGSGSPGPPPAPSAPRLSSCNPSTNHAQGSTAPFHSSSSPRMRRISATTSCSSSAMPHPRETRESPPTATLLTSAATPAPRRIPAPSPSSSPSHPAAAPGTRASHPARRAPRPRRGCPPPSATPTSAPMPPAGSSRLSSKACSTLGPPVCATQCRMSERVNPCEPRNVLHVRADVARAPTGAPWRTAPP